MLQQDPIAIPRTLSLVEHHHAFAARRLRPYKVVAQKRAQILDELASGPAAAEGVLENLDKGTVARDKDRRERKIARVDKLQTDEGLSGTGYTREKYKRMATAHRGVAYDRLDQGDGFGNAGGFGPADAGQRLPLEEQAGCLHQAGKGLVGRGGPVRDICGAAPRVGRQLAG